MYKKGVKLRFVGGMWKSRAGKLVPFYKESPEPDYPEGQLTKSVLDLRFQTQRLQNHTMTKDC